MFFANAVEAGEVLAAEAHRYVETDQKKGNVVITVEYDSNS